MPPIRILSDQVINQIAAGEVIGHFLIKRLVENSIDEEPVKSGCNKVVNLISALKTTEKVNR